MLCLGIYCSRGRGGPGTDGVQLLFQPAQAPKGLARLLLRVEREIASPPSAIRNDKSVFHFYFPFSLRQNFYSPTHLSVALRAKTNHPPLVCRQVVG